MSFESGVKKTFSFVGHSFVWIGKELAKAAVWLPRLVTVVDDVEGDATTLLPEIAIVIDDSGELAKAVVKDSGADIIAAENLVAAISTAFASKGLNLTDDKGVITAFEVFIKQVTASANYADILVAAKKLALDYDTLGASAKAALAKLEKDA